MEKAPLRISQLAQMAKSPAHCKYAMDHESKATKTMNLGTLAHAFMLGKTMPCIYPGKARRGKEWTEFEARYPEGTEIFLESELTDAREIARAVMQHDDASRLMLGRREETILWTIAGRECRGTPDIFNTQTGLLNDLKTTATAERRRFTYQCLDLAYFAKQAWYLDGLKAAGIGGVERSFITAVENKPPYAIAIYQLTPGAIEFGRRCYRSWFEQFLVCEASNQWPGYPEQSLEAPDEFALEIEGEEVAFA